MKIRDEDYGLSIQTGLILGRIAAREQVENTVLVLFCLPLLILKGHQFQEYRKRYHRSTGVLLNWDLYFGYSRD